MCARLGVVRDEEREAADARDEVLKRGERDGKPVVGGRAAPQLVHYHQAARRGCCQDCARLAQLLCKHILFFLN